LAKLVINPTSATKKEIPILARVISIGRDPSNDLVLSDSMVSRRHAILEHRDNQYVLRDNNSSNGTLVNGDRVESEKTLRDGDLVAIGSSRLLFQLDETAEASIPDVVKAAAAPPRASMRDVPSAPAAAPNPAVPAAPRYDEVRCSGCGKTAVRGDHFCRGCGRPLRAAEKSILCSQCGNEVALPADFCGRCGTSLAAAERPAFVPPPAARAAGQEDLVLRRTDEIAQSAVPPRARNRPLAATVREPAGFGIRLLAFVVDEVILGIPVLLVSLAWMTSLAADTSASFVSLNLSAYALLRILYYLYFWGARGATPGKSLLGLGIVTMEGRTPIGYGRALLRLLGYAVSSAFLGIGFLLIAFSPDRRGLHDRIAGTRVERIT
jgi:uncharacterized RDD family membrane protein YckC